MEPGKRIGTGAAVLHVVVAAALFLMVPLVAMQYTTEVAWDLLDFAAAGALLVGTGLMHVMLVSKVRHARYRAGIYVALALTLLLVWLELAAGIFS